MKLTTVAIALICAVLGASCAARKLNQDSAMGRDELYGKAKTIAIVPLDIPPDVSDAAPVAARFEALITERLRSGGYAVVPAHEFTAVFEQVKSMHGGYFSVVTGKFDEAKYRAVLEQTRQQFRMQKHIEIDAVLYPSIETVRAKWQNDVASWDGISEPITPGDPSAAKKGASSIFRLGHHGTVAAYSLALTIKDMHGDAVYTGKGGIQILQKLLRNTVTAVSRSELFADDQRNKTAVRLALNPITAHLATMPVTQSTLPAPTVSARN